MQGISADCFFMGVCCGALFTLPFQVILSCVYMESFWFSVCTITMETNCFKTACCWNFIERASCGSTCQCCSSRGNNNTIICNELSNRVYLMVSIFTVYVAMQGVWTVLPYIVAGSTALFLFLRRNQSV